MSARHAPRRPLRRDVLWGAGALVGTLGAGRRSRAAPAPAPLTLVVDAREAPRRILHARMRIPAKHGTLTLVYPAWLPGEHGPTGRPNDLIGFVPTARGRALPWRRDPLDLFAIHVEVPAGADAIDVAFDFVTALGGRGAAAEAVSSPRLLALKWNHVVLYPKGARPSDLSVRASVELPTGWSFATALPLLRKTAAGAEFKPVSLETLVDAPLHAGAHGRSWDLGPAGGPVHALHVHGDSEEALAAPDATLAGFRRLVDEAHALFGGRPYRRYDFLLALSDHIPHGGLEHHESSDNRLPERSFLDEPLRVVRAGLLPHELVHTWNGKHRRPAELIAPDYQQPVKTELLWVYEGLTTYLGEVLTARSGLRALEPSQQAWAQVAGQLDARSGRAWRSLADTAATAPTLGRAVREWRMWRRGLDYYPEAQLIWLEVDALIRGKSNGARTLDDFCRDFHGRQNGAPSVVPYTLEDVVAALGRQAAHDWRAFFAARVYAVAPRAPLGGLAAAGWRLVYRDTPTKYFRMAEQAAKELDFTDSIGLILREDAGVADVRPGSAAALAGLGPGMKIVAVNGRRFSTERLLAAIMATRKTSAVELLAESGDDFRAHHLKYNGGPRYPALERIADRPDLLTAILTPRARARDK